VQMLRSILPQHQNIMQHGHSVLICCVTELGLLSGIAAILRFPISDPDENEDENDADSSSDGD